jgi:hypothetical protein
MKIIINNIIITGLRKMVKKSKFRLLKVRDAKRLMNRIANEVYAGELNPEIAKVLTTITNTFLKASELNEMELKLIEIENKVNEMNQ